MNQQQGDRKARCVSRPRRGSEPASQEAIPDRRFERHPGGPGKFNLAPGGLVPRMLRALGLNQALNQHKFPATTWCSCLYDEQVHRDGHLTYCERVYTSTLRRGSGLG